MELALTVDKPQRPKMHRKILSAQHRDRRRDNYTGNGSVDHRIRAFLSGETHGEDVLGALYGGAADEPIPTRLLAILKR
jgi:hypothetical protein